MNADVTGDGWKNAWDVGNIGFHKDEVHPTLEKFLDQMVNGRKEMKIFFPLCGKAVDMKWLADKGYKVVGVELASKACKAFFEEQKVEYETETRDSFTVYKSKDGLIKLYCGDLFKFNPSYEGEMDGYWDRGSLVAINKDDRKKYSTLLTDLMAADARGLLATFDYTSPTFKGPPRSVPEKEVRELYGERCNIEKLSERELESNPKWEMERFDEILLLMTKK